MIDFEEWANPLREMRDGLVAERDVLQAEIDHIDQVLAAVAAPPALRAVVAAPTMSAAAELDVRRNERAAAQSARPAKASPKKPTAKKDNTLVMCTTCEKWVKPGGLGIHKAKAHPPTAAPAAPPPAPTPPVAPASATADLPRPVLEVPSLDDVAATYRAALADGKGPVTVLANTYGMSRMSAEHLVAKAREAGLDLSLPALDQARQILDGVA